MVLDPTAREANYRDSMKKYLVDSLVTAAGLNLSFDASLVTPILRNKSTDKWVVVNFGDMHRDDMSTATMEIFCCTREDNEGFKLAQLTDTVMGYLSSTVDGDSTKRIVFYRSYPNQAWVEIGGIIVLEVFESAQLLADDSTKYKILSIVLKFASII